MTCRKCSGYISPVQDEYGDRSCVNCGHVEGGPVDTYWEQMRNPQPADTTKRRLKAQGWRKRIRKSA